MTIVLSTKSLVLPIEKRYQTQHIVKITIKTMFDHDWQFHLLTSVFNKYTYDEEYALFFTNHDITIVNKMWENIDVPPFVEAAEIVASWVNLQRELNL